MASTYPHYINCSTPRSHSKSQMCLFKILHIISSIPPSKEETFPNNNKGVGIDLNLRFCSIEETRESESSVETTASIASAIDQQNINNNNNEEEEEEDEEGLGEKSDNNDHVELGLEDGEEGNEERTSFQGRGRDDSNCLDLLIEAARVLTEKDESVEEELVTRGGRVKKRKERWVVVDLYSDVVEEREPMVRSKRGRSQALPYRFRDSVVEPLKRSGRPSSTHNTRKRLLH